MPIEALVQRIWYEGHPAAQALRPLAGLFAALSALRRIGYRLGWLPRTRLPVPVIVVGNINVGGVGKTPVVIHLVERLRNAGLRPGVIARGYGGASRPEPVLVVGDSDPAQVGDEPVLIAQRCSCPVAVSPNRIAAGRCLLATGLVDVLVSDDGLQHYTLARDCEVLVVDGERRFGNGYLLPAGPLRESPARLDSVDLVLVGGGESQAGEFSISYQLENAVNLASAEQRPLAAFAERTVHAIAAIGNPGKFFAALRAQGLTVIEHGFADHHRFQARDLQFVGSQVALMTEKDAVKCRGFGMPSLWAVPLTAAIPEAAWQRVLRSLPGMRAGTAPDDGI